MARRKPPTFLQEFCITKHGALAAVEKRSGKVIGYLLFHPLEQDIYEMGWIFHRNYWRQGYASEACQRLIQWGFSDRMAHKILAETIDAVKSVGLMKKLGMQRRGRPAKPDQKPSGRVDRPVPLWASGRTGRSRRTTLVQTAQPFKDKRLTMCCHRTSGPLPQQKERSRAHTKGRMFLLAGLHIRSMGTLYDFLPFSANL